MVAWIVSRPHTRNTLANPCSVSVGLLEYGEIISSPASA